MEEIQTLDWYLNQMGPLIMRYNPIYWVVAAGAVDIKEKGFRDWSSQEKNVELLHSSTYQIPTVLGTVLGTGDIGSVNR